MAAAAGRIVSIRVAGKDDLELAREMLREYADYLVGAVGAEHINLENYERELDSLPAPYDLVLLAFVYGGVSGGLARSQGEEPDGLPAGPAVGLPAGIVAMKPLMPMRSAALARSFPGERACELKRLWVRPEFRGMRIGQKLSQRVADEARSKGYTAIYLDTMPDMMPQANRIYADLGFIPVERFGENAILRLVPGSEDKPAPEVQFFRREL